MGDNTGGAALLVQAARDLGGWFGKHLDGPTSQVSGMIEDRLKYTRAIRVNRLARKFNEELAADGGIANLRAVPTSFALAALEEGSMEEDDDLQDIWARLLANAADASSGVSPRRAYISMIKDMTPLDAIIFESIYSVTAEDGRRLAILTHELPARASDAKGTKQDERPKPSQEVIVSLANLARIGAIEYGSSWSGGEIFDIVNQCVNGQELFKAIRRRSA